jgi:hypothetical protein
MKRIALHLIIAELVNNVNNFFEIEKTDYTTFKF